MVRGLNQGQIHKSFEDPLPFIVRVCLFLVIVLILLLILHVIYEPENNFAKRYWRALKPDALVLTAVGYDRINVDIKVLFVFPLHGVHRLDFV